MGAAVAGLEWRVMGERVARPTELLLAWSSGEVAARDALVPLVQDELRQLARHYMARERAHHTLQPTALVNEAYLRLIQIHRVQWKDRSHFFTLAARVMRRILVDSARAHRTDKRGRAIAPVPLEEAEPAAATVTPDLEELDRALEAFGVEYPRQCEVVELRYFGGLSLDETADALGISRDTVKRDWRFARLWLLRAMGGQPTHDA
jgi:RNA polymerase sigma factor (TIGR02999 family)